MTPNEEQFRQAISQLGLPKAQMEAICDLHSAIYEAIEWKNLRDTLTNLDSSPMAMKAGKALAAGLVGTALAGSVYNTNFNDLGERLGLKDHVIEQSIDERYPNLPERDFLERDPVIADDDSIAKYAYEIDANPMSEQGQLEKKLAMEKEKAERSKVRDKFDVKYPEPTSLESSDSALRKFISKNLSWDYKKIHTPEEQEEHIDRIMRAVKHTASITSKYGITEGELIAIMCVESMFDDRPNNPSYYGIAQLGDEAIKDAQKHANEFGLDRSAMNDPYVVEDAVNLAAGYLLYIMYDSARSNKVNEGEVDDTLHGDMRFVFACYNGGLGYTKDQFNGNEKSSIPYLYRKVLHGKLTPNQAVMVKGAMSESLSYPSKIFQVLDYLKTIGVQTRFNSRNYIYRKR